MTSFEMIKYHSQEYPSDIPLRTEEVAAHFDITSADSRLEKSMHTEYSYGKRKWNSDLVRKFPELLSAQKEGVPQLWKNENWALQFAEFIVELAGMKPAPKVIEIHPPFSDYTDISKFAIIYAVFESKIKTIYPDVEILIENRCGSVYHGGSFILSKIRDIELLCNAIVSNRLTLKIAYDVPQIYTAHNSKTDDEFTRLLMETKPFCMYIGGVHLWGKRISLSGRKVSHCGNLETYFGDSKTKEHFLHAFQACFDDDITRKMVLEVNSGNADLLSIINDLRSAGICFV